MYQHIDYFLALDSEPESLKYDEVIYRIREREEMYHAFGVEMGNIPFMIKVNISYQKAQHFLVRRHGYLFLRFILFHKMI